MDTVSVIITTYGRTGEYLRTAIESVYNQTYKPIEIIVVDDNGLNTEIQIMNAAICKEFADLKYVINHTNMGAQYSRNIGILESKGEYVAFLDDDDLWDNRKIEFQMPLFNEEDIGLVYCYGYVFWNDDLSNLQPYVLSEEGKEITFEELLSRDSIGTTSQALIRKSCFAKIGLFDVDFPARQDYEMWLRISKYYQIKGCYIPLFYHRMHSGEQISKNNSKAITGQKKILEKYSKDYRYNRKAKSNVYYRIARLYYLDRNLSMFSIYIIKSVINAPYNYAIKIKNHLLKK